MNLAGQKLPSATGPPAIVRSSQAPDLQRILNHPLAFCGLVGFIFSVNSGQTQALARLLKDGDPHTTGLLREQLCKNGEDWVTPLQLLVNMDDENVSREARKILSSISQQTADSDFDLLCRFFPENGNLEEACWILAATLDPDSAIERHRTKINAWGRTLLIRISGAISTRERVQILSSFLCEELEFRGNTEDYYNPRNSLLPSVLETRSGLPISLCCLAIFLSHRAGMNVVGVNLPGHFIARHGDVLFDPFHRGRILTRMDCEEILRCQGISDGDHCYKTANARQMLQRILCNLHFSYSRSGEEEKVEKVRIWLESLRRCS